MDIEGAAQKYVLSYPIPPGSLAALRSEIDGKTPDNVKVDVTIANNVPTVTLTPVIKGIGDKISGGVSRGIDSIKSAITPTPRPPAVTPTQPPKVNGNPSADLTKSNTTIKTTGYKGSTGAQEIQKLNPAIIDVNQIHVGQKIKLPNGSTYVVKKGDTLDKIAAGNSVSDNSDWLSRLKKLAGF